MLSLGLMTDLVLNDIVANPNKVHTEAVERYIAQHYRGLCTQRKIVALRREATLTPDSDGICILPSDLVEMESVQDESGNDYTKSENAERTSMLYDYNWFEAANPDILFACNSGSVTSNSETLTFAAASGSDAIAAGDYVKIGEGYYPYRIESITHAASTVATLSDGFRGASASSQRLEFRPAGTKAIGVCDRNSNPIIPDNLYITYYSLPLPLYNRYDPILLPGSCEDLRLMVIQSMLRRLGKPREARQLSDDIRMEKAVAHNDNPRSRDQFRPNRMFSRRTARWGV